jgi:hypothetical protein
MFQLISWALSTIVTAVITHELLPNYVIDFSLATLACQ